MRALLSRLLGVRKRREGRHSRRERAGHRRGASSRTARALDVCQGCAADADVEELKPALRFRREALHGMETSDSRSLIAGPQKKGRETAEERRLRRIWEKQQQALGMQAMRQTQASVLYAKRQILEATSTQDLLEKAENLIEQDWLGKIDEMPGSMYFIGAFGDLTHGSGLFEKGGLKDKARLFGCCIIAFIQIFGPPAVFFSTIFGWGIKKDKYYHWSEWDITDIHNCMYDWRHVKLTKFMGILFNLVFVLNGLFVILDGKQAFFKIYNIFQYLRRNTPNFDLGGKGFLYLGAFVNCWTVCWCCLCSYVIVGSSESPKDILFDALGLLFIYNLDDISGDLGFVDEDDWPGLRLGWIHAEMVKKDWVPGDEEEPGDVPDALPPCVKGCGRPVAPGVGPGGRPFDTCCRGCGRGEAHDEDCKQTAEPAEASPLADDSGYVHGETTDWTSGGWRAYYGYTFTAGFLCTLTVLVPVVSAFTPFLLIVPEDN